MNNSARRLNELAKQLASRRYLEIGVLHGNTFRDVNIEDRTAVDPNFGFDTKEMANASTRFFRQKSDVFFESQPFAAPYDIAFIDGLHTFEQVVRDFSNVLLRTHNKSVIVLDDTVPDDVYSTVKDISDSNRYRKTANAPAYGWQGDVFKTIFYIHDFFPSLNYRTITGAGNPQTLVWRSNTARRSPLFNDLERISRLTYFDLQENSAIMQPAGEAEAIAFCVEEIKAL